MYCICNTLGGWRAEDGPKVVRLGTTFCAPPSKCVANTIPFCTFRDSWTYENAKKVLVLVTHLEGGAQKVVPGQGGPR